MSAADTDMTVEQPKKKRKKPPAKPTRIYSYCGQRPTAEIDHIYDQLRLANRYRNALARNELQRRAESEAVLQRRCPEVLRLSVEQAAAEAAYDALVSTIKAAKAAKRRKHTPAESASVKAAGAVRKKAREEHKQARLAAYADPALKAELDAVSRANTEREKQLRAASGLYWGTYLAVEQDCKSFGKGPPPVEKPYLGEGKIAVQCQGGLSLSRALAGTGTMFRLILRPTSSAPRYNKKGDLLPAPDPRSKRSAGRRLADAWIRVETQPGGVKPVWTTVPVVLHRMPPPDAEIAWVYLVRRKCATHEEWRVQLVLTRKQGWPLNDTATTGRVGIDVGWRLMDDKSLRVAVWSGDDGWEDELRIPADDVNRWRQSDEMKSDREKLFNPARDFLDGWLSTNQAPDWLVEQTEHLSLWKSPNRLAHVVYRWRSNRFSGDDTVFTAMDEWRRQDRLFYDQERAVKTKAIRWRDWLYRNMAVELGQRYHTAIFEDADWRQLARLPGLESDEVVNKTARYDQKIASVGRFRTLVAEAMARTEEAETRDTTRRCHRCLTVKDFDRTEIMHTCTACGLTWDQDINAARNLLASTSGAVRSLAGVRLKKDKKKKGVQVSKAD